MNKAKTLFWIIIITIFILILISSSFILLKNLLDFNEIKNETTKLVDDVMDIQYNSDKSESKIIDWEKLESTNIDIIGWIEIEDTNINYPIMQDKDLYYMNHTYEKKYNRNGSIFTKTNNPFKTEETILYGHNNKNGLMFADIQKYMDEEFFYNHQTFKIYTKSGTYDAKVFSIYSIGVSEERNNIKNLSFNECIEYYKNKSKINIDNIEFPKNIVKLSTCSYINNKARPTNQRYYLVASLIENN